MLLQVPWWLPGFGRVLFASYFLLMGVESSDPFSRTLGILGRKGVPLARVATILTILMMVGGSILTMFNWHRSLGAVLLFGIIFPAPFFLHHFWNETDIISQLSEFAHFIKDISLAGAALVLLSLA